MPFSVIKVKGIYYVLAGVPGVARVRKVRKNCNLISPTQAFHVLAPPLSPPSPMPPPNLPLPVTLLSIPPSLLTSSSSLSPCCPLPVSPPCCPPPRFPFPPPPSFMSTLHPTSHSPPRSRPLPSDHYLQLKTKRTCTSIKTCYNYYWVFVHLLI